LEKPSCRKFQILERMVKVASTASFQALIDLQSVPYAAYFYHYPVLGT
jgi:hypothetical protein